MTLKFVRLAVPLGALALMGGGCTKHARMERHLSHGDKFMQAGAYDNAELEYRTALQFMPDDPEATGRLGTLYFDEGRILAGYVLLHRAVERDLENPHLRLTLGLASLTAARTAEARTSAQTVLKSLPDNEDALLLLVATSITYHDIEESRKTIEALQAQNKDSASYHVALGQLRLMRRDFAGAEAELRKALEMDPKSAAAYEAQGSLEQMRHHPKDAAEALKQAADLSPVRSPRRLRYVDYLFRTGASAEAAKELAKITTQAPDYLPAWTSAMQIAFAEHRYEDCEAAAQKILGRDPANYDALMEVALIKLAKKQTDDAITDLRRIEGYYPHVALVEYQLGLAYLDKRDTDSAQECLSKAVILSPNYTPAIVLLAEINLRKGNSAMVVASLEPLIKKRRRLTGRAYFLLAQAYRAQGDLPQALSVFQYLASLAPKAPEGPYLVGSILAEMGRAKEAHAAMEQSLKFGGDYWPALEELVDLDLAGGESAAAVARLDSTITQYPKAAAPWLLLARVQVLGHNLPEAQKDLLKAIDLEPASPYAYLQLAQIYFSTNQAQEAIDKLSILTAKTNSIAARMQLGMLHAALKQYDAARSDYEKILAQDPRFIPALNNLAVVLAQHLGQIGKGYAMAKRARDLAPKDSFVEDTLGWILFLKGDYPGALALLQDCADRSPTNPEIQYHAGMVHYRLGQEESARSAFRKCVAAAADSPVKEDARRRLAVLDLNPAKATAQDRADLEDRVRQDAKDPFALSRLAAVQERAGSVSEAAANFEAALKLAPRSATIMASLSRLYFGPLKDMVRARKLAIGAHEQSPNDATIMWNLGRILYATGEYGRSADFLKDASRSLSGEPDIFYDLALAYYGAGRVPEAEGALQTFLADPGSSHRQQEARSMAELIAASKSPALADSAVGKAQEMLAKSPDAVPALQVLALAKEKQGDYPGAAQLYEKILAHDPVFAPAERQLAILDAEKLGQDDKALDLATKARKILVDDPQLDFEIGLLNYRQANYPSAIPFLQQSLGLRADDAQTLFYLGMSHYEIKNSGEARRELRRAMDIGLPDKDSDDATRVLDELARIDPNQ